MTDEELQKDLLDAARNIEDVLEDPDITVVPDARFVQTIRLAAERINQLHTLAQLGAEVIGVIGAGILPITKACQSREIILGVLSEIQPQEEGIPS